ncbi:MAG TPA: TetR/AcrR family transcriptional regulator [Nitrospirales bacterium]|nr:TetR/AcrR family transcriptional regulator [Nitrospirales bacterium]HIN33990.1 TetR/AcrR family transcriptional regulator [Nitrospirales bacterium]
MPRTKEYVREEVLEAATRVFWERGYEGTSVENLVTATGLHRRSMYGEFGDKDGLFLACIDHYVNTTAKHLMVTLQASPRGLKNIGAFFRDRVEYAASGISRGCLLVNTAIENTVVGPKASAKARGYLQLMEEEFYACLMAAKSHGHIPEHKDCRVLARYLTCFLEGLMVMGKDAPDRESLERVVQTALETVTI